MSASNDRFRTRTSADDAVVSSVRAYVHDTETPDLEARVMRDVRALPPHRSRWAGVQEAWAWLMAPRRVTLPMRPAYGLVAGMAVVLLFLFGGFPAGLEQSTVAVTDAEEAAPVVYVQFRLDAPQASAVQLAGTFSEWEPRHSLTEVAPGVWTATVPVRAGVHEYAFVVDGAEWRVDPYAPQVDDSFGGVNNRLPVFATATSNG